jgi:DNA-binding CsgD family transcriptional regulator/signal transduction histidine kinase
MQENRHSEAAGIPNDPLDAVEAERRRMARLLQASVIDPLNLLLAQTSAYEQTLGTHQPTRLALSVLSTLARQVLQQARDIEDNLRPTVLDELGLEPALDALASQVRRVHGLQVNLVAERLRDRPPLAIELALFRAAQDALDRAIVEARAQRISIRLERRDERLILTLADDGAAPTEQDVLRAARRRIIELGGVFATNVGPHGGLEIVITIAVAPPAALTSRELEVLRLLAEGLSNKAIAGALGVSPRTINFHLDNLYAKLGVASRTEAAVYALRQGWARPER